MGLAMNLTAACHEEGPAESAGRKIDDTTHDAGDAMKTREKRPVTRRETQGGRSGKRWKTPARRCRGSSASGVSTGEVSLHEWVRAYVPLAAVSKKRSSSATQAVSEPPQTQPVSRPRRRGAKTRPRADQ